MAVIRKNGKAYDSGDVIITIAGVPEDEVVDITYNTDQEHQKNHSLANKATSWSMGKIDDKASITLYMSAVNKLEKAAGGSLLRVLPFDIQVTFANEFNDIINDTLTAKFMSQGRTVDGSMGLKQQFDLFVLDIDFNNA
jgi:hypothetical protein